MPLANISWKELDQLLSKGDFQSLFVGKLGWDYPESARSFAINITKTAKNGDATTQRLDLVPVVEKKSVSFLTADVGDTMITKDQRRRAERELTRRVHEHIVIYHTSDFAHQVWQIPRREPGKPIRLRELDYRQGAAANELHDFVRQLHFSLRDEANLTLVDVIDRIDDGTRAEKVTKKFYDEFSKQRKSFVKTIVGIADENDRAWYAAIMLNRLMFSWFLQSKGLLNGDPNYLPNKLREAQNGKLPVTNFQSFYETFLKALFHDALNQPNDLRDPALKNMLGDIPYINGGIFDRHRLETENTGIEIPDKAFKGIFALFSQYTWHLDDRPIAQPNEINPDVLGHIFEKFVNQKEKGAYYTKEDVTGYMSQNTIIPWLLDHAKKNKNASGFFDHTQTGSVWRLLAVAPEKYIYGSMKHGVVEPSGEVLPMPEPLVAGADDYSQRDNWNQRAEEPYALPTETWREHFHRRKRTLELIEKLRAGEVHEIDDLITYNLDIRQFMQDIVATEADISLVKALWHGVRTITILDPTVGSGAFLFAAVRVLEPIADELLNRMEALVEAEPNNHPNSSIAEFKRILEERNVHPNQRYFIMRQIILHNLYGVDIEEEAVEICKLRLFLLLVAHLDDPKNIEPLPDLDFNIRAGNTLVGYATRAEVDLAVKGGKASQMRLDLANNALAIDERAEDAARLFEKFKNIQTTAYADVEDLHIAKKQYEAKISELRDELDGYLYQQQNAGDSIEEWRARTQPFHWFAEFHRVVIGNGGFDVIIGNPPYVRTSEVRQQYYLAGFRTSDCPDIYAMVMERTEYLISKLGRHALIVPLSISFSKDFSSARSLMYTDTYWLSSFDNIPAALFSGVSQRCTIIVNSPHQRTIFSTILNRWRSARREGLMASLYFTALPSDWNIAAHIPRIGSDAERKLVESLETNKMLLGEGGHRLYVAPTARNYVSASTVPPPHLDLSGQVLNSEFAGSVFGLDTPERQLAAFAVVSSELAFAYWLNVGDGFHVTKSNLMPLIYGTVSNVAELKHLSTLGYKLLDHQPQAISFKKNSGKYVGSFDFSDFQSLLESISIAASRCFGLSELEIEEILESTRRTLSINESRGERGIPDQIRVSAQNFLVDQAQRLT